MANVLANIARVLSVTTGQGTLTLGQAVPGFNTFAGAGVADGQTVTYAIEDYSSDTPAAVVAREVGQGVYSAGTLTRGTVYSSTSSGSKINCSGRQHVFITAAKEDFDSLAIASDLTAHLNDTTDAHDASAISFTPAGNIAATDVQAAIAELDSEKLSTSAAAAAYQPLDADLTSIAALTSAANKVPYSTGAGAWALADFSAAGRNLVDDATTADQRTTLGLGTAATQNTGTSGNTVPLLDAANSFSAAQTITTATSFATNLYLINTSADNLAAPIFEFYRNSASPAAGDVMGMMKFLGNNDIGTQRQFVQLKAVLSDPTNTSEDSGLAVVNYQAGAFTQIAFFGLGVYVGSPTGFEKGTGTLNAVTLYENGTSLASKYQGLDSELTAIAGLTSAADRLPYFTGSGTADLATFTAAGRALVDDADASAQRTTLGLGTAAVKNTGTSGDAVPLLNGANTFSAQQIVSTSTAGASSVIIVLSEDGAGAGPIMNLRRYSASPAPLDIIGQVLMQGYTSAAGLAQYASFNGQILDATSGSEDGSLQIATIVAGASSSKLIVKAGVVVGTPTGDDQGAGTLNAVTLYENGTSLASKYGALASANVFTAAQTVRIDDATTNAVTVAATLSHTTTGAPATGIGVGLNFEAETSAGNNEVGARISAVTTDVTSTSEDFDLVFSAMAAGAAVTERGRITSKGTYKHQSFTVAGLPAGTAGETCFASNGRKNGEGVGVGTGVLVFHDGTNWCACDTGAAVAA